MFSKFMHQDCKHVSKVCSKADKVLSPWNYTLSNAIPNKIN